MTVLPTFDPRSVPVVRVDHHLPSLVPARWAPEQLARRFATAGDWKPELVAEPRFMAREPQHAAVLVPLVQRHETTVLLTQRPTHMSTHSGQVAFPGGKIDPSDASPQAAALREAEEEIGLAAGFIQVLGTLPTYTTGSAFIITPVVALVTEGFILKPNPEEVADVFEVPLAFLMNPANHRHHAVDWAGARREWLSMPYPDPSGERFIWGATAGMLRNLYQFLRA